MMPNARRFTPEDRKTVLRRALVALGTLIEEDDSTPLPVDVDTLDDDMALALIGALARQLQARGYGAHTEW